MKKIFGGTVWDIQINDKNEKYILTATKVVKLSIDDNRVLKEYGKVRYASEFAVSPLEEYVVIVNTSGQIFAYDFESGEPIFEYKKGVSEGSTQILFINNSEFILTDWDQNVRKVNLSEKSVECIMRDTRVHYKETFLSDNCSEIISFNQVKKPRGSESEISKYYITDGEPEQKEAFKYKGIEFERIAKCRNGFYCCISTYRDHRIIKINAESYRRRSICTIGSHEDIVIIDAIAVSADEKYVAVAVSGASDGKNGIYIYDGKGNRLCFRELAYISKMKFDKNGILYIATWSGLYECDVEKEILCGEQRIKKKKPEIKLDPMMSNAVEILSEYYKNADKYTQIGMRNEKIYIQHKNGTYEEYDLKTNEKKEYDGNEFESVSNVEWI